MFKCLNIFNLSFKFKFRFQLLFLLMEVRGGSLNEMKFFVICRYKRNERQVSSFSSRRKMTSGSLKTTEVEISLLWLLRFKMFCFSMVSELKLRMFFEKKLLRNSYIKKCKYERRMNVIP